MPRPNIAWQTNLKIAKEALEEARESGDALTIDLAENTLNAILDSYPYTDVTRNTEATS